MRYAILIIAMLGLFSIAQAADDAKPGYFVALLKLGGDGGQQLSKDAEGQALAGHIAYLNQLYDQGVLYMAGPFTDTGDEGVLVLVAASAEEARALASGDPSVQAGLMQLEAVRPWFMAFSKPEGRTFTMEQFQAMMAEGGGHEDASSGTTTAGTSSGDQGGDTMEMTPGAVSFVQIPSTDKPASATFYSTLFGWQVEDDPSTGMTFYTAPGGMMGEFNSETKPAAAMTGATFFINCESVKTKLAEVEAAGGKVYVAEMALPQDWGHIAIIGDSSGNAVGLWSAGE